jgi:curved DNA-binding protein CbpA
MYDWYAVLGIRQGATTDEIKAAFRRRAREFHPDLSPPETEPDPRLRLALRAYEILSDASSRRVYDMALARHHAQRRRRFGATATTFAAVCTLTLFGVWAVLWHEGGLISLFDEGQVALRDREAHVRPPAGGEPVASPARLMTAEGRSGSDPAVFGFGPPPDQSSQHESLRQRSAPSFVQPRTNVASTEAPRSSEARAVASEVGETIRPTPAEQQPPGAGEQTTAVAGQGSAPKGWLPRSDGHRWLSYLDARFGFALAYPADVFVIEPGASGRGYNLRSRDGRARLFISASINSGNVTLANYRQDLVDGTYKGAMFDYAPQRSNWFVLSGTLGVEMFYERVTFACDGRALHRWKLVYPLSQRLVYDRIVEEVHRRYSYGNGPGRRCA